MARINIEDGLDQDPRFRALCRSLGSDYEALGRLVRFWQVAQQFWGNEKQLVPPEIFKLDSFEPLLEFGLAEKRTDGFYARGAEGRFAWYLDLCRHNRAQNEAIQKRRQERRGRGGSLNNPAGIPGGNRDGDPCGNPGESQAGSPLTLTPTPTLTHKEYISPPQGESLDLLPTNAMDFVIAEAWAAYAKSMSKTVKPQPMKWANTIRLLREKDGLTFADVEAMLAFVVRDDFWKHQAISLEGLRTKSKNGLRKFENILAAMKKAPRSKPAETIPQYTEADLGRMLD